MGMIKARTERLQDRFREYSKRKTKMMKKRQKFTAKTLAQTKDLAATSKTYSWMLLAKSKELQLLLTLAFVAPLPANLAPLSKNPIANLLTNLVETLKSPNSSLLSQRPPKKKTKYPITTKLKKKKTMNQKNEPSFRGSRTPM
jgi:hypothetical protein